MYQYGTYEDHTLDVRVRGGLEVRNNHATTSRRVVVFYRPLSECGDADFNKDTVIDTLDLLEFLNAWNACR